jgi:hypothetical protein
MAENNHAKLFIQPSEPVSKFRVNLFTLAALLTKEVGFVAMVSWLGGISPTFIWDSFFCWPTLIILCSCQLIDAENNFKASFVETILTLMTVIFLTLQTEFQLQNFYIEVRLVIACVTLVFL